MRCRQLRATHRRSCCRLCRRRSFPGHETGFSYALVGFPDGSAAVQATISPTDLSDEVEEPPERLWLIRIDAAGQAGHWTRLPALRAGAETTLGLSDGSVVFWVAGRWHFYLAKVDRSGTLLWERDFGSGTVGSIRGPVALADGLVVLEDQERSCRLRRFDENGIEQWHVDMPDPIEHRTDWPVCVPDMVAPRADGCSATGTI